MATSNQGSKGGPSAFNAYRVGQVINAVSARLEAKTTTPPERYNQATLLDDMLNAHKFGRNPTEVNILKATEGLGTSRTRVSMITGLIKRGLLETVKVGKQWQIRTSTAAREMLNDVPEDLRNVAMTARWELALAGIREGKYAADAVMAAGYKFVDTMVEQARALKASRVGASKTGERGSLR